MKGAACCSLSYTVNLRVTAEKSKHDCVREPRVLCNGISSRHLGTADCQTHTHHTHPHTSTRTHAHAHTHTRAHLPLEWEAKPDQSVVKTPGWANVWKLTPSLSLSPSLTFYSLVFSVFVCVCVCVSVYGCVCVWSGG